MNFRQFLVPVVLVFSLSFLTGCNEQFPKTIEYNKVYALEQNVDEVLRLLNSIEVEKGLANPAFSTATSRANHFDNYLGQRLYFHFGSHDFVYDTVKVVDEMGQPIQDDPYDLVQKRVANLDTNYLNPDGYFRFQLPSPSDSGNCEEVFALLQLTAKPNGSQLLLHAIRIDGCDLDFEMNEGEKSEDRALTDFERILQTVVDLGVENER